MKQSIVIGMKPASGKPDSRLNHRALFVSIASVLMIVFSSLYEKYGSYYKTSSIPETVFTSAVPEEYITAAAHQGTITEISYTTKDYSIDPMTPITKTAYVYLPYGYDAEAAMQYDVLYTMHGWMMKAQDYLDESFHIRDVFDHLIEDGKTRPFIAVCLTFDAHNEPQTYERSVEELAVFQYELRNDVIPAVEAQLSTYAASSRINDLRRSRSHRAFAGFSMGSVTTWHQFLFNLDLIHSFVPMSGDSWIIGQNGGLQHPEKTVSRLVSAIHDGWYKPTDYLIYCAVGAQDPMFPQVDSQVQEMMRRQEFSTENMIYGIKQDGYHDMNAVREYFFNALPVIFPPD